MYKIIGADDKEYGPISAEQLRQWISEGRINANTKVQMEGTGVWKRVAEMPEFAAALPVAPTPVSHTAPISMGPLPVTSKTSLMAVWAMITGLVSLLTCCWMLGPLPIILGCMALSRIKKNPQETGSGFAIAGIVLGIISVILMIVSVIVFFTFPQYLTNLQNSLQR